MERQNSMHFIVSLSFAKVRPSRPTFWFASTIWPLVSFGVQNRKLNNRKLNYTVTRNQGRNDGGQGGHNSPGTESLWERRKVPSM